MQRLRYSKYFKAAVIMLDMIVIAGIFVFFFIERNREIGLNDKIWQQNILSIILLILFWILLSGTTKLYSVPRNLTYTLYLQRILYQLFIFIFGTILLGMVSNNIFLKGERFWLGTILFAVFLILKSAIFFVLKYIRTFGVNHRNIMFLGQENDAAKILESVFRERRDYGFKIHTYPEQEITVPDLAAFWKEKGIHTIYLPVDNSGFSKELEEKIFNEAEKSQVYISLIPNILQNNFFQYDLNYVGTQPVLVPTKFPLDYFSNSLLKRMFDIAFSILFFIFIGIWLFPFVAILIKMDSEGPIFFTQKRYGYHDTVFNCLKFRTMVVNPNSESATTKKDDVRITKIGNFLRKTSIDEMPQFINVLRGEMSVIGPRPHMLIVDDFYKPIIGRYSIRSLVKPGISGLAQVNGLRGDEGNMDIGMQKRLLADTFYVKNWTFVLDLVIIFKTLILLVRGDKNAR